MIIEKLNDSNYYVTNQQSGLSLYENDFNSFVKASLAESYQIIGKLKRQQNYCTIMMKNTLYRLMVQTIKYEIENETFSNLNLNDGMLSNNVYDF